MSSLHWDGLWGWLYFFFTIIHNSEYFSSLLCMFFFKLSLFCLHSDKHLNFLLMWNVYSYVITATLPDWQGEWNVVLGGGRLNQMFATSCNSIKVVATPAHRKWNTEIPRISEKEAGECPKMAQTLPWTSDSRSLLCVVQKTQMSANVFRFMYVHGVSESQSQ